MYDDKNYLNLIFVTAESRCRRALYVVLIISVKNNNISLLVNPEFKNINSARETFRSK
jgi:hypothetical protein